METIAILLLNLHSIAHNKYILYKCNIQILNFVLCRKPFVESSNYSFKSSWVSLYKLCSPGFGQFIPFFLADPLKLHQIGWEACGRKSSGLPTDV